MAEVGSIVDGKYEILKLIGKGGMSRVYLAMDKRLNKQWAVKEIQKRAHDKNNEIVVQSAIAEANMIKSLDHPALPRIVDIIEEQDYIFVIMDYIEGETLSKLVRRGAQPQEVVIDWAKQLCAVLDYLHTRTPAIIYRDMKPGNVMLKPDGTVKLIDFGIAREYKEQNLSDTVSLGTKGYAAPEQFGGRGQTDARTDIYCLGVTLHHLLTGHSPTDPPYELYPIRQYNAELSAGLEEIIQKCIQLNPQDRYQSCAELLYALEHYEDGEHIHKKHLKKKLHRFIAVTVAGILCLGVGIGGQVLKTTTNNADYSKIITQAEKSSSADDKIRYYNDAIAIKPGTVDAYEGLIKVFKEDMVFTNDEEVIFLKSISNNLVLLQKDKAYAQLSYDIGCLYWYYYDYGNSTTNKDGSAATSVSDDNQLTRMKSSIQWFGDAVTYGDSNEKYYAMAKVYSSIGTFNKEITLNVREANEKGQYGEYWTNIMELIDYTSGMNADNRNEIAELNAYQLALNALESYARNFKNEGVSESDMRLIYKKSMDGVSNVHASMEATIKMKSSIEARYDAVDTAIKNAFAN